MHSFSNTFLGYQKNNISIIIVNIFKDVAFNFTHNQQAWIISILCGLAFMIWQGPWARFKRSISKAGIVTASTVLKPFCFCMTPNTNRKLMKRFPRAFQSSITSDDLDLPNCLCHNVIRPGPVIWESLTFWKDFSPHPVKHQIYILIRLHLVLIQCKLYHHESQVKTPLKISIQFTQFLRFFPCHWTYPMLFCIFHRIFLSKNEWHFD